MDREEDDPVGEGEGLTPGVDLSALLASLASSDGFGGCKEIGLNKFQIVLLDVVYEFLFRIIWIFFEYL